LNFSLHPHVHTNTHKYDWIVHQPKTSIILSTHCFGLHAGHLWFLRGNRLQSNNMHPHTHIYIYTPVYIYPFYIQLDSAFLSQEQIKCKSFRPSGKASPSSTPLGPWPVTDLGRATPKVFLLHHFRAHGCH
jgi:hypothetical protein